MRLPQRSAARGSGAWTNDALQTTNGPNGTRSHQHGQDGCLLRSTSSLTGANRPKRIRRAAARVKLRVNVVLVLQRTRAGTSTAAISASVSSRRWRLREDFFATLGRTTPPPERSPSERPSAESFGRNPQRTSSTRSNARQLPRKKLPCFANPVASPVTSDLVFTLSDLRVSLLAGGLSAMPLNSPAQGKLQGLRCVARTLAALTLAGQRSPKLPHCERDAAATALSKYMASAFDSRASCLLVTRILAGSRTAGLLTVITLMAVDAIRTRHRYDRFMGRRTTRPRPPHCGSQGSEKTSSRPVPRRLRVIC